MSKKNRKEPTFIEEARRKQIVESAIETLASRGFINTSLTKIAEQVGVTKGVIFHHFDGKDDLINTTLNEILSKKIAIRQSLIEEQTTATDKLRAYFRSNLAYFREYPKYVIATMELWASFNSNEEKLNFHINAYEPSRRQLVEIFELGQENGEFRKFDNHMMASLVQSTIDGITFMWCFTMQDNEMEENMNELLLMFEQRVIKK